MNNGTATCGPWVGEVAPRRPLLVMCAGLALTALVPLVDLNIVDSLVGHIRQAYLSWLTNLVAARLGNIQERGE